MGKEGPLSIINSVWMLDTSLIWHHFKTKLFIGKHDEFECTKSDTFEQDFSVTNFVNHESFSWL